MGRVVPLHVEGRVRLRIAQLLGLLQGLGVRLSFIRHPGEDKIGSSVHDPEKGFDLVGHQTLPQGQDDRDAPADAGLEADMSSVILGRPK